MASIISGLPATVAMTLVFFLLALLTGWIGSIVAGYRSERGRGLRGLLLIPLTNPVALLIFLFRDTKAAAFPVACYVVALICLPLGGALAERIEKWSLQAYEKNLASTGESLSVESLIPEPVPAAENVWEHPFLQPLAVAGQPGPVGEEARKSERYEAMSIPKKLRDVRYVIDGEERKSRREGPYREPFQTFHEYALASSAAPEVLAADNAPESWADCGELLSKHFEPAAADFVALEEALARPFAQYPYAWGEAFNMLLPQLSKAKAFSQSTTYRSMAGAAQGRAAESFRDVRTALRLIDIGDSDLLICRLVQWAQASITLHALMVAQQFHVWDENQWAAIQEDLAALDFPAQVPDSMRAERIFGHATLWPMLDRSATDLNQGFDTLGSMADTSAIERMGIARASRAITDFFLSGLARAFVTRQWRLALEAYEEWIAAIENAREASRTEAWQDLEVAELSKPLSSYGILAQMLLPALGKAFEKAITLQTNIELATVACALERYYLAQGVYPESLDPLAPTYLLEASLDPMTRQPWRYERTGDRGFRLYSVGRNGIDDGGMYSHESRTEDGSHKDDYAWIVGERSPPLPEFVVNPPPETAGDAAGLDPEMMKRYGLRPANGSD